MGWLTMARGLPALWSTLVGVPLIGSGTFIFVRETTVPHGVGLPVALFGGFIVLVGLYVQFVAAPEKPSMREGEEVIDTRTPSQRVATARSLAGLVVLGIAGYLLAFTLRPYVYPAVTFLVGLYLLSTGLHTYWTNTLTVYYVTNQRLIKEYRFVSLIRHELPFEKVRGVQERRSVWETLVGLGNVRVASGGGGGALEILISNIYSPTEFADEIRDLI
jgi:hypothetical protein